MGPIAQRLVRNLLRDDPRHGRWVRSQMGHAMHVHLDAEMMLRIQALAEAFPAVEFEGRIPHREIILEGFFGDSRRDDMALVVCQGTGNILAMPMVDMDCIYVGVLLPENPPSKAIQPFFRFRPRTGEVDSLAPSPTGEDVRYAQEMANVLDLLFVFMAEPRFIVPDPFSPLKRSMAARAIGQKALKHTWIKLAWTVGGKTRAKGDQPGSAPQKAFHMVRGHWRDYGDRQTPKAERRPGRDGWWVWIESYKCGNPALGEIKHHYQPRLDPEKSGKAVVNVLAARQWQAMEDFTL